MATTSPAYLTLLETGQLSQRVREAFAHLESCDVCPLRCGVNRLAGELGICQTGALAQVSSFGPHPGEERPLSGWRGSGTIFFARCNLRCVFCQNADISQLSTGREVSPNELAAMMLNLQKRGCHNINLVSPSHVIPQILAAIEIAASKGLMLPIVYNTGGYDSLEMLALLEGVIDIYMPDMKYADPDLAFKYSRVRDYPRANQAAVLEMQRQVGDLQVDERGLAWRGLLVRHLVLPEGLAGSEEIFKFLAEKVSKSVYLNIMAQYRPAFKVRELPGSYPELNRYIHPGKYQAAINAAKKLGLTRLDL
ncbi:MAG: radical SAM protein [Anaerolineaceae bacterium]